MAYPELLLYFNAVLVGLVGLMSPTYAACDFTEHCANGTMDMECGCTYNSARPLVRCDFLPPEFYTCEDLYDWSGNESAKYENGYGCTKFGGQKYEDVERGNASCSPLEGIECYGNRTFFIEVPCIKYTGHYFLSTLLYSVLLGFLGMDRFCLGHTGVAIGKLLTLGGVGVWWIIDIILLCTGLLLPADDSNWEPYY